MFNKENISLFSVRSASSFVNNELPDNVEIILAIFLIWLEYQIIAKELKLFSLKA
jgi:hypothetical protein